MSDGVSGAEERHVEGIEFIVRVMLLRLKNTVEKLSTLVHGYPLWFPNVTL